MGRHADDRFYLLLLPGTVATFFALRYAGSDLHAPPPGATQAQFEAHTMQSTPHDMFMHVLLSLGAIIVVARACVALFKRLRQPQVIGEVMGGILLGPSALGQLWPEAAAFLLPQQVAPVLSGIAQIGVMFYMFLVGLEQNPTLMRGRASTTLTVSLAVRRADVELPTCLACPRRKPLFAPRSESTWTS